MRQISIGVIVLLVYVTSCSDDEVTKNEMLLKGNEYYRSGDPVRARDFYERSLRIDSCFADALNNLGILEDDENQFERAEYYYSKALNCNPDFLPTYFNRFKLLFDARQYYRALEQLDEIEKYAGDTLINQVNYGLVHTRLRNYNEALNYFTKAIDLDSTHRYNINRGTIYYYLHSFASAKRDFKLALLDETTRAEAANGLSMVAVLNNNLDEAYFWADSSLSLSPNQPYYLNNMGYVCLLKGELEKGAELINESISIDANNSWTYRNKGWYYFLTEDYDKAEKLLLQAERMDPFTENINWMLFKLYQVLGKQTEACKWLKLSVANHEFNSKTPTALCTN